VRATEKYAEASTKSYHDTKVRQARSQVSTGWNAEQSAKHNSMMGNRKRAQQERFRQGDIEKENYRLLQRFHEIGAAPSVSKPAPRPRARSLNCGIRKKELDRIQAENQHMLRRLQSVKPTSNMRTASLQKAHAEHQKVSALRMEVAPKKLQPLKERAQMGAFEARLQERLGFMYDEDDELEGDIEDYPADWNDPADFEDFEVGEGDVSDGERVAVVPELDFSLLKPLVDDPPETNEIQEATQEEALRELQMERQKLDFQIAALGKP
jgi:hypothetical protein